MEDTAALEDTGMDTATEGQDDAGGDTEELESPADEESE